MRRLVGALLFLSLVAAAVVFADCGKGGPVTVLPSRIPVATGELQRAVQVAKDYVVSQGFLSQDAAFPTFSAPLTVAEARQLLEVGGRPDPFSEITPLLADAAPVWVVVISEQFPQSQDKSLPSVTLVLDGGAQRVLWASKTSGGP